MLINLSMIIITFEILFLCLFTFTGLARAKSVDIETPRFIRNTQIQKLFIENIPDKKDLEEKVIISSTRVPSWETLDEHLEPNQKPIDFTEILHAEQDPFKFNYFLLSNDRDIPLWKPSDPNFVMPFSRHSDLLNFQFDPPFLNFTESLLFVTSTKSISLSNLSDKYEIKIVANKTDNSHIFVVHDESFNKVVKSGIRHKIKIGFTPATTKSVKASISFTVDLIHVDTKETVDTLYFAYDVFANNITNPFNFDPLPLIRIPVGEPWETAFSIFNPFETAFKIENVFADDEELEIKVPWDVNTILEENKDDQPVTTEPKDLSVIWDINPNKKQKFLYISYVPKAPGIKKMVVYIETGVQNFTVPVVFKVKNKAMALNKEIYDLGVVTNPRIPHDLKVVVTNKLSYPVQIIDIYAMVPQDTRFRIFQLENKTVLAPNEQTKLVAKFRLLPVASHKSRGYEGKFFIQTNDTANGHFIEGKYRFAYHKDLLHASSESEVSFFVRMQGDSIYTDKKDTFNYVEDNTTGGILELVKTVHLSNRFYTNLELQRIFFPSEYFTVKGVKSVISLPMRSKEKGFELVLRIPIQELNTSLFNSWIGMECYGMIVPLHINVYDKRLHCAMNIYGEEIVEKCSSLKDVNLDFGYIAMNEIKTKTLMLKNFNPYDVSIVAINCSLPNCYTEIMEASLDRVLNEKDEVVMKDKKVMNPLIVEKPIYRGLGQYHKAILKFRVDKSVEEIQKGEIKIQTIDEVITLPFSYQVIEGNLTFTPQIVRFQPAFPNKKQEAKVAIRNLFNTVINIKQIESENPEIIPVLTTDILNPHERVEAFKITFDPSKNRQMSFLNNVNSSGAYIYGITLDDLYGWKEAKTVWDDLITSSSTEIRDWVRIINDVSERTFVQVRASLTNPLLIREPLDFGVTKVHSRAVKNITIENPSDLPIYVQLFLGPEEFSNPTFVSQMFKSYGNEEIIPPAEAKHLFCLVDFMFDTTEEDGFVKAFLEDKTFQRYNVQHLNLGISTAPLITVIENESKSDQTSHTNDLSQYANKTYHCVEGNIHNIDSLILNYTEKFTKRLIQEEDQSTFEVLHFQNLKETPIYEIRAMSFASPKPLKETQRAQTVFEKMGRYFQSWFDSDDGKSSHKINAEQSALMEKLKQNIKEIYIQNFNSLQKEQQIFLDPTYRDLSIFIPPHSDITIPALIHQPNSNKEYNIMLYIKNNLTSIFEVPIKGTGGSGNIIVTDVKRYDEAKKIFVRSTEELLEGDIDNHKMKFYIDKSEIPMIEVVQCAECPPGTKKLRLDKPFRRKFTLKNDGNLPLKVTGISIQSLGCEGYGFSIEECQGFDLEPNQEHDLELKFIPDMSLTYFTRTLEISTNQGTFEFEIHVKLPFKNLYDNFDIYHFKSKFYVKVISYVIIIAMAVICAKVGKDLLFRKQSRGGKKWELQGDENLNYKHPNEIFESTVPIKHNFTPIIPVAKMIVPKKPVVKVEKNVRTSKTPVKQNEFKEETAINLKKFEDSDGDNAGEIKIVGGRRKKASSKHKKETKPSPPEEVTPTIEPATTNKPVKPTKPKEVPEHVEEKVHVAKPVRHPEPVERVEPPKEQVPTEQKTAETVVIAKEKDKKPPVEKPPVEKQPVEKKPYEKKTFERRAYEKKMNERKVLERKIYEKKKQDELKLEEQKAEKAKKVVEPKEPEKKGFESEHEQDNENERNNYKEKHEEQQFKFEKSVEVEEEKKSESNQPESNREILTKEIETKHSLEQQEEDSDEGLEGDILYEEEAKNVVESVIGAPERKTSTSNVGHIGSKAFEWGRPEKVQPQNLDQSLENSEVTSEDDSRNFYNYFGNYQASQQAASFNPPHNPYNQYHDNSRQPQPGYNQYGSYFNNNDNILANTPGLGLFQTKRKTPRYDQHRYFPTPRDKNIESPRRGPNLSKPAFYTGSEDESGAISESSYSSRPFGYHGHYNESTDEMKLPERTFNIPNENNPFSFAQLFFPNMENVSSATKSNAEAGTPFFEKDRGHDSGFDEKNLNYIFGAGVRFRNLKEGEKNEEPDSSELPPGLH